MDFCKPSLENIEDIRRLLKGNEYRSCDYCVGTLILWSDFFRLRYTEIDGAFTLAQLASIDETSEGYPDVRAFSFPLGNVEEVHAALDKILARFHDEGKAPCLMMVNREQADRLEEWYPGLFEVEYDRSNADYIYLAEKLSTLAGSKLHGKRNHINRFIENYPDYIFEELSDENRESCKRLEDRWNEELDESGEMDLRVEKRLEEEADYEEQAISFALDHLDELGLSAGVLRIPRRSKPGAYRTVAFAIGEKLTDDCFVVHFEKAIPTIQGAYPMINREFVRRYAEGFTYVNREEDLGVEGLRKSKMSYHPELLYEKGIARLKQK